jgi:hypothetical protein
LNKDSFFLFKSYFAESCDTRVMMEHTNTTSHFLGFMWVAGRWLQVCHWLGHTGDDGAHRHDQSLSRFRCGWQTYLGDSRHRQWKLTTSQYLGLEIKQCQCRETGNLQKANPRERNAKAEQTGSSERKTEKEEFVARSRVSIDSLIPPYLIRLSVAILITWAEWSPLSGRQHTTTTLTTYAQLPYQYSWPLNSTTPPPLTVLPSGRQSVLTHPRLMW